MLRRSKKKGNYSGVSIFSSKIKCGQCGSWFGAKVWHSNDKYRRVIYRCNHKFDKDKKGNTPHLTEDEIKEVFVKGINKLIEDKRTVVDVLETITETLCDTEALKRQQTELGAEMARLVEKTQDAVAMNARVALNQAEYQKEYNRLVQEYESVKGQYDDISGQIADNLAKSERITGFLEALRKVEGAVDEFDEALWSSAVDEVIVRGKDDIRISFKGDIEIEVDI